MSRHLSEAEPEETLIDFSAHFHVSIGWILEAPSSEMMGQIQPDSMATTLENRFEHLQIRFDTVKVKVGNAVTVVSLPTKVEEDTGLIAA